MPLQNIPVLDKNYPLFDWSEHQDSRNALAPNNLVSDFKKETWNDIVDTLNNALSDAGLHWDSLYTTESDAKIYKPYGALTATMFNSVRHNIDVPASIGWAWYNNENFRGFIGRVDFRGYGDYGKSCDFFYPEYIIELVRKLNILIGIMKDSANITNFSFEDESRTLISPDLIAKESKPITIDFLSKSIVFDVLSSILPFPILIQFFSKSNISADIKKPYGLSIRCSENINSNIFSDLSKNHSVGMFSQKKSNSSCESLMIPRPFERFAKYSEFIYSDLFANMVFWTSISMRSHRILNSISKSNLFYSIPIILGFFEEIKTIFRANIYPALPYIIGWFNEKSLTKIDSELVEKYPIVLECKEDSSTTKYAKANRIKSKNNEGYDISISQNYAELESAWYAPIWIDDKLYIQQTINNVHSGEILYIDETPELSVFVGQNSIYSAQIDTAWLPVSVGVNSIYIQQAFDVNEVDDYLEVM